MALSAGLSLSGHPLEGTKFVRLVFMDEAGISTARQEPWVVVVGVLVNGDNQLTAVERHLDSLVRRFIPEEHWGDFVFQAKHLFNGGGKVFKRDDPKWPIERRLEIADQLALIPKRFKLPITWGFSEHAKMLEGEPSRSPADRTRVAHAMAFITSSLLSEMWLRKETNGENCILVVEDNQQMRTLLTETQEALRHKEVIKRNGMNPALEKYYPLRRIKQRPLFEEKAPSSALQIADFCAYVSKRKLMNDERYNRFFFPFFPQIVRPEVLD